MEHKYDKNRGEGFNVKEGGTEIQEVDSRQSQFVINLHLSLA